MINGINSHNNAMKNRGQRSYRGLWLVSVLALTPFTQLLSVREIRQIRRQINRNWGEHSTVHGTDGDSRRSWNRTSFLNETRNTIVDETTAKGYALDLVYLPLLPWETESLVDRTCNPPLGVPEYCCIGSLSSGGEVSFQPSSCNKSSVAYEYTNKLAFDTLLTSPVVSDKNGFVRCDVCRITDILLENNWTLAFQGDSITRQTFVGLECELRRRGYSVTAREAFRIQGTKPHWRIGLDMTYELRVSKTPIDDGDLNQSWQVAFIRFYGMYRPNLDMKEVSEIAKTNDFLIFDHGLHYGVASGSEFVDDMTAMVTAVTNSSERLKLLAWRETSAQHFDTPGGHFLPGGPTDRCVPMDDEHVKGGNRLGAMMREVLNITGTDDQLTILPFREYTSQLHYLHTNDDCSHFCSSPSLWLPLWRLLRVAMDTVA